MLALDKQGEPQYLANSPLFSMHHESSGVTLRYGCMAAECRTAQKTEAGYG